jgi:hypothetical protein
MMSDQIRVGVIGVGQIGTSHLAKYSEIPQVKVMAVSDASAEKVEEAKGKFGIPHGYGDFMEPLLRIERVRIGRRELIDGIRNARSLRGADHVSRRIRGHLRREVLHPGERLGILLGNVVRWHNHLLSFRR